MEFRVEDDFWQLFPAATIGVVVAHGINNRGTPGPEITGLLADSVSAAAARLSSVEDIGSYPDVAPWREAYRAFGVKPNKYRSSIESLLRSARSGVRSINPLVDIYNAVSLRHRLPCGGEDLRAVRGDIRLTRALGDELFVPLGSTAPEPPQFGEVIYKDDEGVLCRCWNWREAERTKLTPATSDAFLCIEALPPLRANALVAACDELAYLVQDWLGGSCRVEIVSKLQPRVGLE